MKLAGNKLGGIGMQHADFLKKLQRYVANIAITASTLRNQGAKKVVDAARSFLAELDLTSLKTIDPARYPAWLEATTQVLRQRLPRKARRWGTARKAINIFMVQAFLNRDLAAEFHLTRLSDALETPLDKFAVKGLRQKEDGDRLPRWPGVGKLTNKISQFYQDFASRTAQAEQVPRACLDVVLWRTSQ